MPWNEQDFIDIGNRVAQLERQRQEMLSGLKSASEEINCFRVYFDSGCDEVRGQRDLLDRAVAAILETADRDVVITGHTDRHGGYHDNMALAAKRAISVKYLLVIRGVPPGRIECVSAGFTDPRLSGDPTGDAADIMNRRVEVSISARNSRAVAVSATALIGDYSGMPYRSLEQSGQ